MLQVRPWGTSNKLSERIYLSASAHYIELSWTSRVHPGVEISKKIVMTMDASAWKKLGVCVGQVSG